MPETDAAVESLAELFRDHPAWIRAARHLRPTASSAVYFRHRPGEAWHLAFRDGGAALLPGHARDPDFAFCFSRPAIDRLAAVRGGIGDFAVELFLLIAAEDEEQGVGLRIVAPFMTLVRKGYVGLLLAGGVRLVTFGAERGVRTLGDLRRLVARFRTRTPRPWETAARDAPDRRD